MLHSIQGRIILGSIVISAVVLAVLGVVVGEQLRRVAGASIATQTQQELQPYIADLRNQPGEQPDRPAPGEQILVISPQGDAVIDTLHAGLTTALLRHPLGTARVQAGGVGYVAVGDRSTNALGTWRIWAVRSSVAADLTVQGVSRILFLTAAVVLVLVALGSLLLVRAALRPVRRLRRAAESIRSSGVAERLPDGRGRDEITALAATLNRFLEAQQRGVEREQRMVADASHEMRTPLAVLTTQLELAHRNFGDAGALEKTVREVESNVAALSRLTTQLLELSQLESVAGERGRGDVPVRALLSELMLAVDRARSLAPRAVEVGFDIDGVLDEDAVAPLTGTAFGRIVDNLTMNALHATTTGTVEVRLTQTSSQLVLTVTDSGTGVPEEFLPQAFGRFTRSEQSRAAAAQGSGLGLALVRALVDAAGGDATLRNGPTGGAIATVVLPVRTRHV